MKIPVRFSRIDKAGEDQLIEGLRAAWAEHMKIEPELVGMAPKFVESRPARPELEGNTVTWRMSVNQKLGDAERNALGTTVDNALLVRLVEPLNIPCQVELIDNSDNEINLVWRIPGDNAGKAVHVKRTLDELAPTNKAGFFSSDDLTLTPATEQNVLEWVQVSLTETVEEMMSTLNMKDDAELERHITSFKPDGILGPFYEIISSPLPSNDYIIPITRFLQTVVDSEQTIRNTYNMQQGEDHLLQTRREGTLEDKFLKAVKKQRNSDLQIYKQAITVANELFGKEGVSVTNETVATEISTLFPKLKSSTSKQKIIEWVQEISKRQAV